MCKSEQMVTISKSYFEQLKQDSLLLQSLKVVGVDNWEGYSAAFEFLESQEN